MAIDARIYRKLYLTGNIPNGTEDSIRQCAAVYAKLAHPDSVELRYEKIRWIAEEVVVWRNAYCIHEWFRTHCDKHLIDRHDEVYLSKSLLQSLVYQCREAMAKPLRAEWYFPVLGVGYAGLHGLCYADEVLDDIRHTAKEIDHVLRLNNDGWCFYYLMEDN